MKASKSPWPQNSVQTSSLDMRKRLEAVKEISFSVNSSLDLAEVLHHILSNSIKVIGGSAGMIFLISPKNGDLSWGASQGLSKKFTEAFQNITIKSGEGLTGTIAKTGTPIFIHANSSQDPRINRPVVRKEGLNSFIGVPIHAADEIIGVLNIATRAPAILQEEDIILVAAVGEYVGSAIRNAQQFMKRKKAEEKLERSYQTQTVLNKLLRLSLEDISLEELMRSFISCLISLPWLALDAKGAAFLFDEERRLLIMKAQQGLAKPIRTMCAEVPLGRCLCGRAAQAGKVVFADRVDKRHDINFDGMQPHGHYCVPIMSANHKVLGVFTLYTKEGHTHNPKVEETLLGAASVVASRIERLEIEKEKKALEAKLFQAQKIEAIGTLAGGIAHDFNNILTPIIGYAEMLGNELPEQGNSSRWQEEIITAAYRAKELVHQILVFSRQTEQKQQPTDLKPLIKETLKFLRASIPSTIEIRQQLDPDCGPVLSDPTKIHQIIMNLCTNAFQAMRGQESGVLGVSLTETRINRATEINEPDMPDGPYLKLTISDSGPGINNNVRPRIFEPYFSTKEKGEGTGLGLSVVHGIVKKQGGYIRVDSTPAKGTTFTIYLPKILATSVPAKPKIQTKQILGGTEHILLVDDDKDIATLQQQILEKLGYQVTAFTRSPSTLTRFANQPEDFDLLLTDLNMPEMSGTALAREMLSIRADLPIILCTGYGEKITMEKIKKIGIRSYLLKPILLRDLAATVRNVLDGATLPAAARAN